MRPAVAAGIGISVALAASFVRVPTSSWMNWRLSDEAEATVIVTTRSRMGPMQWTWIWDTGRTRELDLVFKVVSKDRRIEYHGVPSGTEPLVETRVHWPVVVAEQAAILIVGGLVLSFLVRSERQRTMTAPESAWP